MPRLHLHTHDGSRNADLPSTSAQLRDDIDKGRTGDRSAASDPAAAPLGTDEEAAGTPPGSHEIDQARAIETSRPNTGTANAASPRSTPAGDPAGGWTPAVMALAFVGGVALVIAAALIVTGD